MSNPLRPRRKFHSNYARLLVSAVFIGPVVTQANAGSLSDPIVKNPVVAPEPNHVGSLGDGFQGPSVYGGLAFGSADAVGGLEGTILEEVPFSTSGVSSSGSLTGGIVGLRFDAGHRRLVYGAFAEIGAFSGTLTGSGSLQADPPDLYEAQSIGATYRQTRHAAAGVRLGYLLNPQSLLYGLAGYSVSNWDVGFSSETEPAQGEASFAVKGPFAGLGFERLVNENWSLGFEYRHQFSAKSTFDGTFDGLPGQYTLETSSHQALAYAGFRF